MIDLSNKKALVIGGSRGIGAATALMLARQGADVAVTYAKAADRAHAVVAEILATGRKSVAIQAQADERGSAARAVETTVSELKGLDILVVSSGIFDAAPIEELDDERYDATFNVHMRHVFEAARAAVPHMAPGGSIIAIGSAFSQAATWPGLAIYTSSKAAVAGLTRALGRELGPRGITANTVQPGPTDTEMNPADFNANPGAAASVAQMATGRYAKPEEIAAMVTFLASEHGRAVTGQTINVDGGWTA